MPRIQFTHKPKLPRDMAHLPYVAGFEVDLTSDQADRWVRRGVAVYIPDLPPQKLTPPEMSGIVAAAATAPASDTPASEAIGASAAEEPRTAAARPRSLAGRSPIGGA